MAYHNRYQYETSPRKLEPEYRPVKKKYPKKVYVMTIKDEDEIFEIADSYRDAIEQNSIKQYWKEF